MRTAEASDISALVAVGRSIAAESRPPEPFSERDCEAWLATVLASPAITCIVEELANGKALHMIGAVLGGIVVTPYSGGTREARIEYIWVHPEHRVSSIAPRLLIRFKHWAIEHGAKKLYFSSSTGADLEKLARIVCAQECGRNYVMELT